MSSVADLIEFATGQLQAHEVVFGHGTDNAWDEATALVLGVTGHPDERSSLTLAVPEQAERDIRTLLDRRIRERMPLAYLLGRARYMDLEFLVEPGVVIPRSPIGELIRARFAPWLVKAPLTVLDLCCGSGCIGIATALQFPSSQVVLVDVDEQALDLARRNVALHQLQARVQVVASDLFEALPDGARFDLLLANPPYVDRLDMSSLPAEYRHEPQLGLAGGEDGLDLVQRIVDAGAARLNPDGILVCEVGRSSAALLRRYPSTPFIWPELELGGEGVFILPAR